MFWVIAVLVMAIARPAIASDVLEIKGTGNVDVVVVGNRYAYQTVNGKPLKWGKMPISIYVSVNFPADWIPELRWCLQEIDSKSQGKVMFDFRGVASRAVFTAKDGFSVVDVVHKNDGGGVTQPYMDAGFLVEADIGIDAGNFSAADHELFRNVALHEFCHVIGLAHIENPSSLMNPDLVNFTRIDDGTLQGIRFLYGGSAVLSADFNHNGVVDFDDFSYFADHFGQKGGVCDLDGDGWVGFNDFFLFVNQFGKSSN